MVMIMGEGGFILESLGLNSFRISQTLPNIGAKQTLIFIKMDYLTNTVDGFSRLCVSYCCTWKSAAKDMASCSLPSNVA